MCRISPPFLSSIILCLDLNSLLATPLTKGRHNFQIVCPHYFLGHLSNSGDLSLWFGVHRCSSSIVRRESCINIFFSRTTGPIFRVRRQEIVNFMTPRAGVLVLGRGHKNHIVKMHYFIKSFLLYSQA